MSESENEEFDKEAEKRRLREKYEKDRQQREATSRMSDLLLQGATMTNKHCDTCGDPLFRHQGEEFCATCQADARAVDAQPAEQTASEGADAEQVEAASRTEAPAESATDAQSATADRTPTQQRTRPRPATDSQSESAPRPADAAGRPAGSEPQRSDDSPVTSTGVAAARDDLAQTVSTLARRAAAADDPRQARELAEAAREAADALDALR
ncbi:Sjogren's syndrome/scleroderma autoantigen 1 family protein [Halocalculus aciditolerans]|nr:Sjogren's syndrome/scleroderma autoantigen 1 family protein [Halocalculus aciditolerans]